MMKKRHTSDSRVEGDHCAIIIRILGRYSKLVKQPEP